MATSLSLHRGPTRSPLRPPPVHGGGGFGRPAPQSLSSLRLHSPLQNGLSVTLLAGRTSSRRLPSPPSSSSSSSSSSLEDLKGNSPPRRLLLPPPERLMSVDGGRSWSPNRMLWNNGQTRRLTSRLQRRAVSEESPPEVAAKKTPENPSGLLPPVWPTVALALFGLGCLLGPPLDGIHSRVQLQVYDNGAINLFGLETSIWVPPLLGVFYTLAGLLQLVLDKKLARRGNIPTADITKVAASFAALALLLELSAELYNAGVPANIEGYILFFCAQLNWVLFENTWWGFGLAALIGVVCPLAEIPIVKAFGLWHYPQANVSLFGEGFVTWVICCYFFYTPSIGNLARWLVRHQTRLTKEPKQ